MSLKSLTILGMLASTAMSCNISADSQNSEYKDEVVDPSIPSAPSPATIEGTPATNIRTQTPLDSAFPGYSLRHILIRYQREIRALNGTLSTYCELAFEDPSDRSRMLKGKIWHSDSRTGGAWNSSNKTYWYPSHEIVTFWKLVDDISRTGTAVIDSTTFSTGTSKAVTLTDSSTNPPREIFIHASGRKSLRETPAQERELLELLDAYFCDTFR